VVSLPPGSLSLYFFRKGLLHPKSCIWNPRAGVVEDAFRKITYLLKKILFKWTDINLLGPVFYHPAWTPPFASSIPSCYGMVFESESIFNFFSLAFFFLRGVLLSFSFQLRRSPPYLPGRAVVLFFNFLFYDCVPNRTLYPCRLFTSIPFL